MSVLEQGERQVVESQEMDDACVRVGCKLMKRGEEEMDEDMASRMMQHLVDEKNKHIQRTDTIVSR